MSRFWTRESGYVDITGIDFHRRLRTQCLAGVDSVRVALPLAAEQAFAPREPLRVVGEVTRWTGPASVSPTILILAQLIQGALVRPLVVVVDTCVKPNYDNGA
ncbi:MAG: hypothetical protein ABR573_07300 [Candidatus Dormibacteria bacterium]